MMVAEALAEAAETETLLQRPADYYDEKQEEAEKDEDPMSK